MAGELVSFGVQKLWDLLHHEYEQFHGVKDKVTELKRDLNLLSSFLQDADKKRTRAVVRNCLEEIKEIIFDAEDIIETFLLKEEPGMTSGIQKHIKRLASIIPDRKEIALDIEGISKRISKVISDMQSFGVQQIIADSVYITQPVYDRQREMRETFSTDNERDPVGLEANIQALVGLMVKEDNVEVVSITGMGGVGKTTLARQVFNHKKVKDKFKQGLAWVCVTQEFSRISVWQTILRNLRPKEEEKKIMEMTESTLQGVLFKLLETSKSLIVLDDIWKEEDWNRINSIFPPKKDWKVLFTSRNESIAACGDMTYSNFKPECLTFQNSWTLFQRVAFPRKHVSESTVNEEMEEMGKQMVNHCGGLPLAIKVLGGLLAAKYTLHDWKRLSENIKSHIMGRNDFNDSNNSVFYVLSLSFEELPTYLKQCFLYLAHFPEDHEINVEKLAFYWAAEGIPKPRYYHGATIRDVANGYVEELMMRNMVIAENDKSTLRPETFHLHDMMREVCLFKAEEDNFLQIVNLSSSTPKSLYARRLVFQHPTTLNVETDISNPKVRSLLVITDNGCWLPGLSFKRLHLLRLLDLSRAKFEGGKLPSSIGKLIHLRYLSLEDAEVSHLPSSLENLKLLIYLNIDIRIFLTGICVPNILMGMQKLRYLALPKRMKNTKLELRSLVNLETLKNFSSEQSSLDDLRGMTGLRILTINSGSSSSETISSSIGVMRHLESLKLYGILSTRTPFVLVSDCNDLKILKLGIYMPRLPDEKHFPQLTVIELNYCRLEEDPMPILEKLLHLHEVKLMTQSFCGRNMVCSTGGFPQLHRLEIEGLFEWEDWKLEEGSMRHLHTLWLTGCKKLRRLPDRLRFITSLDVVMMRAMNGEWDDNYEKGGAGLHDFKHVPNFSYEGGPYGTDVCYNSD